MAVILALNHVTTVLFSGIHTSDNLDTTRASLCGHLSILENQNQMLISDVWATVHPHRSDRTTHGALPWPPLPHELLGLDLQRYPFSNGPPHASSGSHANWERELKREVVLNGIEPWQVIINREKNKGHLSSRDVDALLKLVGSAGLHLWTPSELKLYLELRRKLDTRWFHFWGEEQLIQGTERIKIVNDFCGAKIDSRSGC